MFVPLKLALTPLKVVATDVLLLGSVNGISHSILALFDEVDAKEAHRPTRTPAEITKQVAKDSLRDLASTDQMSFIGVDAVGRTMMRSGNPYVVVTGIVITVGNVVWHLGVDDLTRDKLDQLRSTHDLKKYDEYYAAVGKSIEGEELTRREQRIVDSVDRERARVEAKRDKQRAKAATYVAKTAAKVSRMVAKAMDRADDELDTFNGSPTTLNVYEMRMKLAESLSRVSDTLYPSKDADYGYYADDYFDVDGPNYDSDVDGGWFSDADFDMHDPILRDPNAAVQAVFGDSRPLVDPPLVEPPVDPDEEAAADTELPTIEVADSDTLDVAKLRRVPGQVGKEFAERWVTDEESAVTVRAELVKAITAAQVSHSCQTKALASFDRAVRRLERVA